MTVYHFARDHHAPVKHFLRYLSVALSIPANNSSGNLRLLPQKTDVPHRRDARRDQWKVTARSAKSGPWCRGGGGTALGEDEKPAHYKMAPARFAAWNLILPHCSRGSDSGLLSLPSPSCPRPLWPPSTLSSAKPCFPVLPTAVTSPRGNYKAANYSRYPR